jgi:predicted transcriptional regulator
MAAKLPELSRFELQCLGRLWSLGRGSIREVHQALEDPPSYSTVKKIFERLEEKGAVERVRREGRAWTYRSTVRPQTMIRKEIRRLLTSLLDGQAVPLVTHLAEMDELSLEDLRELERILETRARRRR